MTIQTDALTSITPAELTAVQGGGLFDFIKGIPGMLNVQGTGSGPNSLMEFFDHPQRRLEGLGFKFDRSGNPGDAYTPAKQNSDGSISDGFFSPPSNGAPSVPISQ